MENMINAQMANFMAPIQSEQTQGPQKLKKQTEGEFDAAMMQMAVLQQSGVNQSPVSQVNLLNADFQTQTNPGGDSQPGLELMSENGIQKNGEQAQTSFPKAEEVKAFAGSENSPKIGKMSLTQDNDMTFTGLKSEKEKSASASQKKAEKVDSQVLTVQEPILQNGFPQISQLQPQASLPRASSDRSSKQTQSLMGLAGVEGKTLGKNLASAFASTEGKESEYSLDFDLGMKMPNQNLDGVNDSRGNGIQEGLDGQFKQPHVLKTIGEQNGSAQLSMVNHSVIQNSSNLKEQKIQQKPIQGNLSGAEFLQTLNSVKLGDGKSLSSNLNSGSDEGQMKQDEKLNAKFELKNDSKFEKKLKDLGQKSEVQFSQLNVATPSGLGMSSGKQVTEISAQVVPGAMSQDRLSSDALIGVTGGIRNLSSSGGGELRIRLKPDNLGELNVRVMTNGSHVGLQIQASDEKAKKIIEDSIHYLKESLSAQNLSLNQVDLTVASSSNSSNGNELNQQDSKHSQGNLSYQNEFGQSANQGGHQRQSDSWNSPESQFETRNLNGRPAAGLSSSKNWAASSQDRNLGVNGRLDVKA